MKLSTRITSILTDGSDGWELYNRARALEAAGHPIIMLTIGEHDIPTSPAILDAMDRAARAGETGYAPIPGSDALRAAVAHRVAERTGVETGPENVLITSGGQAALFAAHIAVLDPGDAALFIDPYYTTYPGTLRSAGAQAVAVPGDPANGFRPRRAALESAARGARSLLINTPNNPTGEVYDRGTLEHIAQVAIGNDLWLISDEVYDTQVWAGEHLSPRALPDMAERTLVVGSMSKSHAMTGSRLGWVVGPREVIAHMINLATNTNYGVPGYIQAAALWALGQGPSLEQEVGAPFFRRRAIATKALTGCNALRSLPGDGGMYLMLDIRATGLSGIDFANALLDREGIAVMPGESFGQAAAGHVRVAMTVADDRFAEALARLRRFAEAHVPAPAE